MQNRFNEKTIIGIEAKQQGQGTGAKPPRDPETEWREYLHIFSEANGQPAMYGHPAVAFKEAMAAASHRFVKPNTGKLIKGAISIHQPLVPIEGAEPEMQSDPVRIKQTWTIAYRPRFWPWNMTFDLTHDNGVLTRDQVINLLIRAGRGVGIGAARVENGPDYGQFRVTKVAERSTETATASELVD